jgi:hypothetical protein
MSRVCRIVLVCEGWRDSAFTRGFLKAAGISRGVEPRTNPGGSGHDWVKRTFAEEVADLGRFSEGRGVLGVLDEDGKGSILRESEVAEHLAIRGLPKLAAHEGRCLLLPARNLETWLYWLTGQRRSEHIPVDETADFKAGGPPAGVRRIGNEDCRPAGEFLHTLDHTRLPNGCPAMLREGLTRLRQFLSATRR